MSLSITDVKQLLGQGLLTNSASAVNPDSEGAENPCKQAKRLNVEEYISLNESWLTRNDVYALRDFASKSRLIAPGSEDSGPSAPMDKAVPKEKEFFSTHLKRTRDFIEDSDY